MAVTSEQFWDRIRESGLFSPVEVAALVLAVKVQTAEEVAQELVRLKKLTPFQAKAIYRGQQKSVVLGSYALLDKLGQGGMGAVYRAKHLSMNRTVALKILAPDALKTPNAVERFQREMRAAAHLEHPNIVSAYDAGQHNGQHYLAMQLIDGADLREKVLQDGPLSLSDAVQFTLQTARGLQYAHGRGVIHRDIKPANLLLSRDGSVKILDMGLARFEHGESDEEGTPSAELTGAGKIMGTVDFMSPEQALETHHADARSDIYSLGCTFYFLLTGHPLYQEDGILKRLLAHRSAPIPSLSAERSDLPESVDPVLQKMLAKQADDRYQSMTDVIQAMEGLALPVTIAMAVPVELNSEANPFDFTFSFDGTENASQSAPQSSNPSQTVSGGAASLSTDTNVVRVGRDAVRSSEQLPLVSPTKPRSPSIAMLAGGGVVALALLLGVMFWFRPRTGQAERTTAQANAKPEKRASDGNEPTRTTKAPAATEETPETPPPVPEPVPVVTTPVVTTPTPTTPEPTASPSVPGQTLIVGIAPGEIGDLGAAFTQAKPGDTILIRHRGPLEFRPVDLTGKTPLTIAGDSKDGVDYWPILRQAVVPEGTAVPPAAKGLFYGKNLQLTFRKVHLGIGGHQRQPIVSAFHLDAGRLEFADCTVTVSASSEGIDPVGALIPLVQCAGTATEPLELKFQRTMVRGGRLGGCLSAVQPGPIQIVADQFLWAGGPAPWLTLQECGQPCRVHLGHSTLYNLGGLASAALTEDNREADTPVLAFQLDHCLLTGPRVASPPLLQVTAPGVTSLAQAVADKWVEWKGATVVWHQITGDTATSTKGASPQKAWCELFGLEDRSLVGADPMFRVRPSGVELQEATGRDFEPRFGRAIKKPPRDVDLTVGPSSAELPVVLACINSRNLATEPLAGVPRGAVRVLRVHQADGPFRKLEDAMSKVQSDDIIEIADNAVYVPTRNFAVGAAKGVLSNDSAECLTIRAVDDSQAVIVLRDDVQRGTLPAFHNDADPKRDFALYLLATSCRSLSLDGLHFRTAMANPTRHSLILQQGPCLRVTNCTCVDTTTAPPAIWSAYGINRFACHITSGWPKPPQREWLTWLENDAFIHPSSMQELSGIPGSAGSAIYIEQYAPAAPSGVPRNLTSRNCLFGTNMIAVTSVGQHLELAKLTEVISFEQCTVLGRMAYLAGGRTKEKLLCTDNLVIAPDNPVIASSADLFSKTQGEGGGNAYWQTSGTIRSDDRNQGSLSLLPGPPLKTMPAFGSIATAADTLKPFRLKPGTPLDKMATDGGPVGVRFEYLPSPPPFRPEMLKRDK